MDGVGNRAERPEGARGRPCLGRFSEGEEHSDAPRKRQAARAAPCAAVRRSGPSAAAVRLPQRSAPPADLPTTLAVEEVEALLASCAGQAPLEQRDRALIELLYATGARVSEAVGLRTDALEPRLRVVRLFGKGSKMRVVPLGEEARAALERWIAGTRRVFVTESESAFVFVTRSGEPLSRQDAWRRIVLAARRAGISRKVSPHTLRP